MSERLTTSLVADTLLLVQEAKNIMKKTAVLSHSSTTIAGPTPGSLLTHVTSTYKQTRNFKIAFKQETNVNRSPFCSDPTP